MTNVVEYRIRPITRYHVTRFHNEDDGAGSCSGGSQSLGEFDNETLAYNVAYALCKAEHERSGEDIGSMNFIYPKTLSDGAETK